MTTPGYIRNLTPLERGSAIKFGALIALAHNGVTPAQVIEKQAAGRWDLVPKSILVSALMAGVPLGMLAHAVGRATATDNRAEREAIDRLRYFQRMTAGMTSGLQPATKPEEEKPNAGGLG